MERPKGLIGKAIGRTNWNTDFLVDQPYRSFKLFFTADSSDPSSYPVQAFLKFSDGSNCSRPWAPAGCSAPSSRCRTRASAR